MELYDIFETIHIHAQTYVNLCAYSIYTCLPIYTSLLFSSFSLSFHYACPFVAHLFRMIILSVAIALIKQIRATVRVIKAGFVANSSWLKLIVSLLSTVLFCCVASKCTRVIVGCIKNNVTVSFVGSAPAERKRTVHSCYCLQHQEQQLYSKLCSRAPAERKWTKKRTSSSKSVRTRKSPCGCVILVFVARSK